MSDLQKLVGNEEGAGATAEKIGGDDLLEASKQDLAAGEGKDATIYELHSPRPGDGGDVSSVELDSMRKSDIESGANKGNPPKRNSKRKRKNLRRREKKAAASDCSSLTIKEGVASEAFPDVDGAESTDADSVTSAAGLENRVRKLVEHCVESCVEEAEATNEENVNTLQASPNSGEPQESSNHEANTSALESQEMSEVVNIPDSVNNEVQLKPVESCTETSYSSKQDFPSMETVVEPPCEDSEMQARSDIHEDSSQERIARGSSEVDLSKTVGGDAPVATSDECYTNLQSYLKTFEKAMNYVLSHEKSEVEEEKAALVQNAELIDELKEGEEAVPSQTAEYIEELNQGAEAVPTHSAEFFEELKEGEEAVPTHSAEFIEEVQKEEKILGEGGPESCPEDNQTHDYVSQGAGDAEIEKDSGSVKENVFLDIGKIDNEVCSGESTNLNETYTVEDTKEQVDHVVLTEELAYEVEDNIYREGKGDVTGLDLVSQETVDVRIDPAVVDEQEVEFTVPAETTLQLLKSAEKQSSDTILLLPEGHNSSIDDFAESSYHFPSRDTMEESGASQPGTEEKYSLNTADLTRCMSALSEDGQQSRTLLQDAEQKSVVASPCSSSVLSVSSRGSLLQTIDEDEEHTDDGRVTTELDEETGERFHKTVEIFRLENPEETAQLSNEVDGIISESMEMCAEIMPPGAVVEPGHVVETIQPQALQDSPIEKSESKGSVKSKTGQDNDDIPVCYRTESSESDILVDYETENEAESKKQTGQETQVFVLHFPSTNDELPSQNNLGNGTGDQPSFPKQVQVSDFIDPPSVNNNVASLTPLDVDTDSDYYYLPHRREVIQNVIRQKEALPSSDDDGSVLIGTADLPPSRTVTLAQSKPQGNRVSKKKEEDDDANSKFECKCARACTIT